MTEEPKKFTRAEIDIMTHDGPAYKEHLKKSIERMRKYKGYMANREEVITDAQEIQRRGYATHVANGDLRFSSIIYTISGLGQMLSRSGGIVYSWNHYLTGPISIFKGYVPQLAPREGEYVFRWRNVYLYEEVLVITKWFAENRERSQHFNKNSPEYYHMWNELEEVRNEIKRRAKRGESTVWTGFGNNRESE